MSHAWLVALVFLALCGAWISARLMGTAPASATPIAPQEPRWEQMTSDYKNLAIEHASETRVVFLGDSLTYGWSQVGLPVWNTHFAPRHAMQMGIPGERTSGLLERLRRGALTPFKNLESIVLCIGTNNAKVGNTSPEIAAGVLACVRAIHIAQPSARIVVVAIPPREQHEAPLRATVRDANDLIARALTTPQVFVRVWDEFLESDGSINPSIMPDFLHMSSAGYERWAKPIARVLERGTGH